MDLCSNLQECDPKKFQVFSNLLKSTFKTSDTYKEPTIIEKKITEGDIVNALIVIGIKDPEKVMSNCKKVVDGNKSIIEKSYVLTKEETVLISLYTYEDKKAEASPYRIINDKLWDDNAEDQFTNKKSYLRLLLSALRKLPRTKPQTLYRGIREDKHEYKVGDNIEWKGFTSTSKSMKITQTFLTNGKTGKVEGTLFEIKNCWGYDVHYFSCIPKEEGKTNK